MRILIDIQALQSPSANRGIGRYSRALIEGLLRQAPNDQIILLLNGMVGTDNDRLRREFTHSWPNVELRLWTAAPPVGCYGDADRRDAAEAIREAAIYRLSPDIVLVSSLFEGHVDDCVTAVGDTPTAVILYDLIPFIFRESYLHDSKSEAWYDSKINALKRADLLLAISEFSAQDAVTHLNWSPELIVNISSDVDAKFVPRTVDKATRDVLATELGLSRSFLMYMAGGTDQRKNIPALISAFAKLPKNLIATNQLAIVCQAGGAEKAQLQAQARSEGLPADAVIVTGYVSDNQLITLYNACKAFVYPSWYEGFGLPVLEAMRCGAAVIGSNVSSIPEVIGREDALFDPRSTEDMARMIEKVLTDAQFRQSLRDFAPEQAARFSWDESARRTLKAMRALVAARASKPLETPVKSGKPRLAFVSPLPPERSGISFYSADLLPELANHYEIDIIVAQDTVTGVDAKRFPLHNAQWLRDHQADYDRVLYQFGNSPFHSHMFDLLAEIPGTVVLHDFFLSDVEAFQDPATFTRILAENHGYHAALERFDITSGSDSFKEAIRSWPANAHALNAAEGIIVHSQYARDLARHFYGAPAGEDWAVIPLLRVPCELSDEARAHARSQLGLAPNELMICSFGHLSGSKAAARLLNAFVNSSAAANPQVHLVFVGEGGDIGEELLGQLAGTVMRERVEITGRVSDERYRGYLAAADLAIQLRTSSSGESAATVLDCLNYGLPVIVNAHGSLADLPPSTVVHIPDHFSTADLTGAIERLVGYPELRAHLGVSARQLIASEHAPAKCAGAYRGAIESFFHRRTAERNLLNRLAQLSSDQTRDTLLAQAVSDSLPRTVGLRQLLVDITELAERDAKTGIQRVIRAILSEWLRHPPSGWRVEPVRADSELGRYRYARNFTCHFLEIPADWASDGPIDFGPGDHFLGLDLQVHLVPQMRAALSAMAASGVSVSFVVYDLLPVLMPQHFVAGEDFACSFARWLDIISCHERLVCISRTVSDELRIYIEQNQPANSLTPQIGWFHLGADLENSLPTTDLPADVETQLQHLKARPSLLMVGTVEPRKGHALVLSAFDQFWARGGDATLVIVGKQGWLVDSLCHRLRTHPENGKRLIWLDKASDAHLEHLFKTCDGLIAASEGEGFGLPLIEASRHDLPILARDIPVFREVAGDHATYFDGADAASLLHALELWLTALGSGNMVRSSGLSTLTWRESAAALLRALDIEPAATLKELPTGTQVQTERPHARSVVGVAKPLYPA